MGRAPCCSKVGLRRGPWSAKEDALLANFIQKNGEGQWRSLPKNAGLLRCGKSCRLRWMNYLRPGIKRGNIEEDEEDLIVRLHGLLGNRWSLIAGRLPGRTDNEIKNYWNTHLLKKLQNAGIQTRAHKDLPRPTQKGKKNPAATKKKGKKKRVVAAAAAAVPEAEKNKKEAEQSRGVVDVSDPPPKTKVYVPKPIRVSQAFPRTESYDSLANVASSGGTSSGGWDAAAEVESYVPVSWPPLFELEEAGYGISGVLDDDDFLGLDCCILPVQHQLTESIAGDADDTMLMQVYDEYQQLIQRAI